MYVPPDPSVAEFVHQKNSELREARDRLGSMSDDQLRIVLYDSGESSAARGNAMGLLFRRLDRKATHFPKVLAGLLKPLIGDPDPDICTQAIKYCPLNDHELISKVRQVAGSDRRRPQSEAVIALAKIKDAEVYHSLVDWFHGDDESYRNLAIEGLLTFNTAQARQILEESYASGGRSENDRAVLAVALLRLGNTRGIEFLKELARRANDSWSVMAATWIYHHSSTDGLLLMRHIVDNGQLEAKQSMVGQVSGLANLPHAYTADGIHEVSFWIDQQLESKKEEQ